ncbi:MAG: DNA translocase FtsK 4TM domain-containing protein, partial [Thermomicrobiaceae bacterium]
MAARATQTKRSPKKSTKQQKKTTSSTPRVAEAGRRVAGWFGSLETPEGVRREVAAVLSITVMALLLLALYLPGNQSLLGFTGSGVRSLFGVGSFIVPLAFLWLAGEALFSSGPGARRRRMVGFALVTISVVSFLHLIGAENGELAGGHLGSGFAELFRLIVGEIGTGV